MEFSYVVFVLIIVPMLFVVTIEIIGCYRFVYIISESEYKRKPRPVWLECHLSVVKLRYFGQWRQQRHRDKVWYYIIRNGCDQPKEKGFYWAYAFFQFWFKRKKQPTAFSFILSMMIDFSLIYVPNLKWIVCAIAQVVVVMMVYVLNSEIIDSG